MSMRLGDSIDDYCSHCKLTMDHAVVTMSGEEPAKVRCRTCGYEHNYRRNKGGKQMTREEAFQKVLASVMGTQGGGATETPKKKPSKKR